MKYEKKRQLTQDKIIKSFVAIAKEKGVAAVTVSDIIKRADVNRSTFYRHYIDKFDLIEKVEDGVIDQIKKANEYFEYADVEHIDTAAGKFVYSFLTVIEENQPILSVLISEKGEIQFAIKLLRFFNGLIDETTEVFSNDMDLKQRKLFAAFNSSTALGIVVFWIHHFEDYDKDYVYDFLMHREY
ncbi:TetR/AcrR family transcriptional regulator [Apilactobacillus apinorum]|uniref:TetR/AcrR family transcriptional regulator n=1 Tax=Apilactobacillus apinorum TaxID=1218495 RepID=A0ABP9ZHF2_9LACO